MNISEQDQCLICGETLKRHNMGLGVPTCPTVAVPTFRSRQEIIERSAREERERIVEWLRNYDGDVLADSIERCDHRED